MTASTIGISTLERAASQGKTFQRALELERGRIAPCGCILRMGDYDPCSGHDLELATMTSGDYVGGREPFAANVADAFTHGFTVSGGTDSVASEWERVLVARNARQTVRRVRLELSGECVVSLWGLSARPGRSGSAKAAEMRAYKARQHAGSDNLSETKLAATSALSRVR